MEMNLYKIIRDQIEMDEKSRVSLALFLSYRCREKTTKRLISICKYSFYSIRLCGLIERVKFNNGTWSYHAGQSYPDEIRTLRDIVLNR